MTDCIDSRTLRDLVARDLDAFRAHRDGKPTREELRDTLQPHASK